jgi:hypothetical protein
VRNPAGFASHLGNRCAIPTFPPPRRLLDCFLNSNPERSFPQPPAKASFRLILRLEKTPVALMYRNIHLTQIPTRIETSPQPVQAAWLRPRHNCDSGNLLQVCGSLCQHILGIGMGHRRADDSGSNDQLRRPNLPSALFRVYDLSYRHSQNKIRRSSPGSCDRGCASPLLGESLRVTR